MPTVDPKQKEYAIRVLHLLHEWLVEKKVGNVQVNFFDGFITSVNQNQVNKPRELKKPKTE